MKKLSRGAYEDTKGFVRAVQTLLEVLVMSVLYYAVWRHSYPEGIFPGYLYLGKYVLMGIYGLLLYLFFQNADCTMFGQLNRLDLIIGQIIALFLVNFVTYFQLCLIAERLVSVTPLLLLFGGQILVAVVLVFAYTGLYYKLYAPHDMLLIYGSRRSVELKIKMDSRQDKYKVNKLISADAGYEKICQAYTEILLLRLLRNLNFTVTTAAPLVSRQCDMIKRYIDANYKESLSLDDLSRVVHINKFYLAHAFKKEYGISPKDYRDMQIDLGSENAYTE